MPAGKAAATCPSLDGQEGQEQSEGVKDEEIEMCEAKWGKADSFLNPLMG